MLEHVTAAEITRARLKLVDLRILQRKSRRLLEVIEARVSLNTEGKNAEERKARAVLALDAHPEYRGELAHEAELTRDIESTEASIELWRDERREREWAIRLRRVEALERLGLAADDDAVADLTT